MPRYEVIAPGFYGGVLCKPGHPRNGVIHTDKPMKPIPTWLKSMRSETDAQRKKREIEEGKVSKAAGAKASADKIELDAVTFTESPKSSIVETL